MFYNPSNSGAVQLNSENIDMTLGAYIIIKSPSRAAADRTSKTPPRPIIAPLQLVKKALSLVSITKQLSAISSTHS